MRLASFNVENMFDRAKAMNMDTWAEGRPALEAHAELNRLFNQATYSDADKARMLALLDAQGLLRKDDGPLLVLRRLRGALLKRPTKGPVTVVAAGRDDWIGWVELKTEAVRESATENTARVIGAVNADILGVVEAEDRTTLRLFNEKLLPLVQVPPYEHVMLIDGNDDRGIDVGILTRKKYPIVSIRSHVDDTDAQGTIFSRDCAEYQIALSGGRHLWVLVNHLKSKGFGKQSDNDAKRLRQAQRIRQIYDAHRSAGHEFVAVIGDFNDTPDSAALAPLLANGSTLRDISTFAGFDDGGRPGTHGNCTASARLDYILLSPKLFATIQSAAFERRGMWGGKNGTLWPHFPELKSEKDAASDHAALWVELQI
jgi:endonuclease/exonuclease/phosphatase family metal-dependent hydrolase